MRGSAASSRSRERRPEPVRGRKPSKQNRSLGRPDSASAVVTALGPGAAVTAKPASSAARTRRYPGSETLGMPPSVTTATTAPPRSASTRSGVRRSSLPSKYDTMRPSDGDVEVPGEAEQAPGVLGRDYVRRRQNLPQPGGGVADVAQRRADQYDPARTRLHHRRSPSHEVAWAPGAVLFRRSLRSRGDFGDS
nr:hypothetical protein GCM10020092_010250 [Actinoplanes digitatis]